jgi:hypothetical protein
MGIINNHESSKKCDRCGSKVKLTYLVYGDCLCEKCYNKLGSIDYKEALDELNGEDFHHQTFK